MKNLDSFKQWLIKRGRDADTAELYALLVRTTNEHPKGVFGRLLDNNLSPYTRRTIKAAVKAYASFTKDVKLIEELTDLKLPPARRTTIRIPIEKNKWQQLIKYIDASAPTPILAVIGMMATRGFRIGDVLRMRRMEIQNAVKDNILIYTAKGGKRLEFGVTNSYKKYLLTLLNENKWDKVVDLLVPDGNDRTAKMRIRRVLQKIAIEVGIDDAIYPHRLRRTVATYFLEKVGGDLVKLKDWMQWSNITTAAGYVDHSRRKELDAIGDSLVE